MNLREISLGGCGLDSTGSGQGPVAGCCERGDEPSGSCATELVIIVYIFLPNVASSMGSWYHPGQKVCKRNKFW
jgi:hypothetical protein